MKKILSVFMALSLLMCFAGCSGTKADNDNENKVSSGNAQLAQSAFNDLVVYLNLYASIDMPYDIDEDDTIEDIDQKLQTADAVYKIKNLSKNARFFDYAMRNPDTTDKRNYYVIKKNVDWLAIYAE